MKNDALLDSTELLDAPQATVPLATPPVPLGAALPDAGPCASPATTVSRPLEGAATAELPPAGRAPWPWIAGSELGEHLAELQPRMTAVAMRFAGNRHAAEDIVQNAYEKVLRNIGRFAHRARLSTWIHRIVVNEALMWLRSEQRRARYVLDGPDWEKLDPVEPAPDPAQRLFARERANRLREAIAALPPGEREVLQSCALGEQSYEDFARQRGTGTAAAKSRAFRARRRLRASLADG